MSGKNHRFTRQELYDLVWSEPMAQLAKKFGLSDVGLAKACRRAAVPVPERGYWAKFRAGKQVIRQSLPPRGLGMHDGVWVGLNDSSWSGLQTNEQINEAASSPPVFPEVISDLTARVRKMVGKVTVPKSLERSHRLIAKLLEEDEQRRKKQQESPYWVWDKPLFGTPFERRRLRILNAIFLALERCDMRPSTRGHDARELSVQVGEQYVHFTLDRIPTKRGQPSRAASSQDKSTPERMRLQILSWGHDHNAPARATWEDSDSEKIEARLEDIVVGILVAGEMQYREGLQRQHKWAIEEKARLEEEARRRREEAERRERDRRLQAEKERIERLLNEASALRQAADIRAYVEAVRAENAAADNPLPQEKVEAWAAWALAEADRIDPVRSGRFLEQHALRGEGTKTQAAEGRSAG